jgi:hypothetical protein
VCVFVCLCVCVYTHTYIYIGDADGNRISDQFESKATCFCVARKGDLLQCDNDGDGLPDATDDDDDNDGSPDVIDTDDDNDGITDVEEALASDFDRDGFPDVIDEDDDGDGEPDETDEDDDDDGVSDVEETLLASASAKNVSTTNVSAANVSAQNVSSSSNCWCQPGYALTKTTPWPAVLDLDFDVSLSSCSNVNCSWLTCSSETGPDGNHFAVIMPAQISPGSNPCGCKCKLRTLMSCVQCASGTYGVPGDTECGTCLANSHASKDGSSQCTCNSGYSGFDGNGSACVPCFLGQYKAGSGSGPCTPCRKATYSEEQGQVSCKECPAGMECGVGTTSSNLCDVLAPNPSPFAGRDSQMYAI